MKKLCALLLAVLFASFDASAQTVGASQIKKKTNAGLVADSVNALAVGAYRASSAPSTPVTGQFWCDTTTTPCTLKIYNGSTWTASPSSVIMTQPSLATLPGSPVDGQIVWIENQTRAIVYSNTASKWYYLDAVGRSAQADYSIDTAGYSSAFLSAPAATTGATAAGGSMTNGTHVCAITLYNSTAGETLPSTTTSVLDTTTNKTINLTFTATGTGVSGKRVYCSKANTISPLFLVASYDDTSTTTHAVTIADGSFGTVTAPDVNFSAPLPSPWVYYAKDRSYGGCGSTGTMLLCSMIKADANSTTSAGVRLTYPISGDPSGWRAAWQVVRLDTGFTGRTSLCVNVPLATLTTTADTAAPLTKAVGFYFPSGGPPVGSASTPSVEWFSRTAAAAFAGYLNAISPWPTIVTTPIYILATGIKDNTNYSYQLSVSGNGKNFTNGLPVWDNSVTQTACTAAGSFCTTTTKLPYLGIELLNLSASSNTGQIYGLSNFTWVSE